MNYRSHLLNNALDALDRLFDRQASVIDIYALTYATAQALRSDVLFSLFSETAISLSAIARAGLPTEEARERALDATNALRITLAELLPFPDELNLEQSGSDSN
jgi:hypothetical protein